MKITVYKQNLSREIESSRLKEYLSSGWSKDVQAADVINLKPVTKAKAVTEKEPGNAIEIKETNDGNINRQ